MGGEGSKNRDRYADSSADERLPPLRGSTQAASGPLELRCPSHDIGFQMRLRAFALSSCGSRARISSRKAELSSVATIF